MTDRLFFNLMLVTALGSGLIAGLFFTFSIFLMTALNRLPPAQGIAAMQSINTTILNPLFGLVFFGTAAASIVLAISALRRWGEPGAAWLLAGSVLYLVGAILVTIVFNVPRNNALAALDPNSADAASQWATYVSSWTAWNHLRTVGTLAATLSFIMAIRA